MGTPYLSEIRIMSFGFAPRGWAQCNGQILPINQNQPLFSLLGTTYGGDGRTTFGLPNLQGRFPVHMGQGFVLGANGGEATHTLVTSEMPIHNHTAAGSSNPASAPSPVGNLWATQVANTYAPTSNTNLNPAAIGLTGNNQPHDNMPPYLTLNFCIALQGIFPSRN